jgi:hypothetical protein
VKATTIGIRKLADYFVWLKDRQHCVAPILRELQILSFWSSSYNLLIFSSKVGSLHDSGAGSRLPRRIGSVPRSCLKYETDSSQGQWKSIGA